MLQRSNPHIRPEQTKGRGPIMQWSREMLIAGRGLRTALRAATAMVVPPVARDVATSGTGELITIPNFGANPGGLSMLAYLPPGLAAGAPLVVLLHGCGQDQAAFAAASGWIALADRVGMALVLPTQSADNNRQRCFNWFRPTQVARGLGEAQSIHSMVAEAVRHFASDPRAVHIVGLSAGGAMAVAMLAAYPDVFVAGASIAGLPVGAASGAASALARMAQAGPEGRSPEAWADQVRRAAPAGYRGPWPRLSIWHGRLDTVVDPANSLLLAQQWRTVHGLPEAPTETTETLLTRHELWGSVRRPLVELWTIPAMAHGYPVDASGGMTSEVLPAGISATNGIARFWGLI
jgi:poly(hydroxyalkanoate) depolymerase family esterase